MAHQLVLRTHFPTTDSASNLVSMTSVQNYQPGQKFVHVCMGISDVTHIIISVTEMTYITESSRT